MIHVELNHKSYKPFSLVTVRWEKENAKIFIWAGKCQTATMNIVENQFFVFLYVNICQCFFRGMSNLSAKTSSLLDSNGIQEGNKSMMANKVLEQYSHVCCVLDLKIILKLLMFVDNRSYIETKCSRFLPYKNFYYVTVHILTLKCLKNI